MSDWSSYELDDVVWDMFIDSSEHVIPRPNVEQTNDSKVQCDIYKKARHDLVGSVEGNPANNGSTEENIFLESEDVGDCSLLSSGNTQTAEHSSSHASKKPVRPVSFTSTCTENEANLTSGNTTAAESSPCTQKEFQNPKEFCSDEHFLEDKSVTDNSCQERISISIPPADGDVDFLVNEPKAVENGDYLDYEWPDIGNFEDVDPMLNNRLTQFGQQSSGTADELSWFSSSSYAIDGSEEGLRLGFRSSYSDLSALRTSLDHNEDSPQKGDHNDFNLISLSGSGELTDSNLKSSPVIYSSYGWLDANLQGEEFASKGMPNSFYDVNGSNTSAEVTNDSNIRSCEGSNSVSVRDISNCAFLQSEGRKKLRSSEYMDGNFCHVSIPMSQSSERIQACHSSVVQPKSIMGTGSFISPHSCDCQLETTDSHSSHKTCIECPKDDIKANLEVKAFSSGANRAVAPSQGHQLKQEKPDLVSYLTDEQKMDEKHHALQLKERGTICRPSKDVACQNLFFGERLSQGKQVKSENREGEMEDDSRDISKHETNHCSAQEKLWSKDNLSGSTCLQQLEDVMDRLDLRIKLCIRDGLYRLARNAHQRHGTNGAMPSCKASIYVTGINGSKRYPGFMDVETGTNPIDRSIAHLLFYRASEQSPSLANDALSFESRSIL